MTTTYRITMTVTRTTEYQTDIPFDTADDEAAERYAQELTPDDMAQTDEWTTDIQTTAERLH